MTSALRRTLPLLCLAFLARAARAEDQAAPTRVAAVSEGATKQPRWFSFLRKARIQRTTRESPPVVSGVVLASFLGGGVAIWLLLRFVRFRIRAGRVSDAKMQEREAAALLGLLSGSAAGMCIYDKVYPCLPTHTEPES